MYDMIVVGGGPAGLTAALYGCRANRSVLIIEKGGFGGQITYSPKVENIPGFDEITGNEFAEKLVEQVLLQNAEVEVAEVKKIIDGDVKTVVTDTSEFQGRTVIIATGAKHRLLGLENEQNLIGEGISFCAVCDGAFYAGKTVAVIGGGNSALQEALLLSDLAEKVYVVQNLQYFTGEEKLVQRLRDKENVEVILGAVVEKICGQTELEAIEIKEAETNITTRLDVDGMFVAIGLAPQNECFGDLIKLNDYGYIEADDDCQTNVSGVFVAGDCRSKKIRQVVTAASDGAIAALAANDYIEMK